MNNTWYTEFYGDSWENMCHILLSIRHPNEYQLITDKGGDMGLDGLVASEGIVYQMYGLETGTQKSAKAVQDKVWKDLRKLKKNEEGIKKALGEKKIKHWVLLLNTQIPHSSIHLYVKEKETIVKNWGLSIIDPDFSVLICDPLYLEVEYLEYDKKKNHKIEVSIQEVDTPSLKSIKSTKNFITVFNKFKKISNDEIADEQTYRILKQHILNASQLDQIQKEQPDFYSEIIEIRADAEEKADQGSTVSGTYDTFSNIEHILETRLHNQIGGRLGNKTMKRLRDFIIADWFVRCPLDFKENDSI